MHSLSYRIHYSKCVFPHIAVLAFTKIPTTAPLLTFLQHYPILFFFISFMVLKHYLRRSSPQVLNEGERERERARTPNPRIQFSSCGVRTKEGCPRPFRPFPPFYNQTCHLVNGVSRPRYVPHDLKLKNMPWCPLFFSHLWLHNSFLKWSLDIVFQPNILIYIRHIYQNIPGE